MSFDSAPLRAEVLSLSEEAWVSHFNTNDYDGVWSSASLRSPTGRANDILPFSAAGVFRDTPLMDQFPALRAVVETFRFPLKAVRLLRLHAGSRVKEHCDLDLGLADGELRIHVPVLTSELVEFVVANRQLPLRAGEAWFVDFSQPHRIYNGGAEPRVHLVIDGTVNAWAEELLQRAVRNVRTETTQPRGIAEFERFRAVLDEDEALRRELAGYFAPHELVQAVVRAGRERGFALESEDVNSVLMANRKEWNGRVASL